MEFIFLFLVKIFRKPKESFLRFDIVTIFKDRIELIKSRTMYVIWCNSKNSFPMSFKVNETTKEKTKEIIYVYLIIRNRQTWATFKIFNLTRIQGDDDDQNALYTIRF